jgi:mono/diheme cytochrome c family protein
MRRLLLRALPALLVLLSACAAGAQTVDAPVVGDAGSRARGLVYAEQTCASCHAVHGGDRASPNLNAPPFDELANDTPGMNGLALNVWLHSSHQQMPHLVVDADHVEDLWAYMASLRRRPETPAHH